jgi:hypothetical protein
VSLLTSAPRSSNPSTWPSRRACATCTCERFEGDGSYCEFCGHDRRSHSVVVEEFAAACTACTCTTFRGGRSARACGACGHGRAIHSVADEWEEDDDDDDGEGRPTVSLERAVVAALVASAGGGLIWAGIFMLA